MYCQETGLKNEQSILIIGVDGGTWTILKPAMEHGYMPFLKSMVDKGASGILESTIPAITPAAWGTFQTGMNPGENGVHDFFQWDKRQKKTSIVNSENLRETIWEIASRTGKRVGVINVPMTYPPKPVNGYVIGGLLTPSLESEFTYPAGLKNELLSAVPDYSILNLGKTDKSRPHKDIAAFVEQMASELDNRANAAEFVINKGPLDILMVHFQAPDAVQHHLWGYIAEGHRLYDAKVRRRVFESFYSRLDHQMQRVSELFWKSVERPGTTFIVSDHGFQASDTAVNLGVWLKRQGYLQANPRKWNMRLFLAKAFRRSGLKRLLARFLPDRIMSMTDESQFRRNTGPYCWEQSRAYATGGNSEGFIYLLEEDQGRRTVTERGLISDLGTLKDHSGNPIVSHVYRKQEIFHGSRMDIMPDLVVVPAEGYSFYGTHQKTSRLLRKTGKSKGIPIGKHDKDGIFVACGNDVVRKEGLRASIADIAPTVLCMMSLPVRADCDGHILTEVFSGGLSVNHRSEGSYLPEQTSRQRPRTYDSKEQQHIEDRLRGLGYL